MANGQQVNIPKFIANNDKLLELAKIDTAQYNKFLNEKKIDGAGQEQSDVIGLNVLSATGITRANLIINVTKL